jgi:hypothetical protein
VLLVIAPLMWAGNAVVGRLVHELVPPITLNFLRWLLAFGLLLPLAHGVLRPDSPVWPHWRRYALLGLLGIGTYNALQYRRCRPPHPLTSPWWDPACRSGCWPWAPCALAPLSRASNWWAPRCPWPGCCWC